MNIATSWTYCFSALGAILLILIPVIILFLEVFDVHIGEWQKKKRVTGGLMFASLAVLTFIVAPGIKQIPMHITNVAQAFGVDFVTFVIAPAVTFDLLLIFSFMFLLIGIVMHERPIKAFVSMVIFIISTTYLGYYCWNFFLSASTYYYTLMLWFLGQTNIVLAIHSAILMVLTFFFYLGVFLLFAYYAAKYILRTLLYPLFDKWFATSWSFVVLVVCIILFNIWYIGIMQFSFGLIISFLLSCLLFTYAYVNVIRESGMDMRFMAASNTIVIAYILLAIIFSMLWQYFSWPPYLLNILTPGIMCFFALLLIKEFKMKSPTSWVLPYPLTLSIVAGIAFGFLFMWIGEPMVSINTTNVLAILIFLFLVAFSEELMFRYIILDTARKSTGFQRALIMQGILFALVHFIQVVVIWNDYGADVVRFVAYFILLIIFGCVMGIFMKNDKNITYPILAHLIANAMLYLF
jgi:membrane protease YdiL (CAAX protease family)